MIKILNKLYSIEIMKFIILFLSILIIISCKTTMSVLQEDISAKLSDYTECPKSPEFKTPLKNFYYNNKNYIGIYEEDFNELDKYITALELCTSKRLMDIIERNSIITELLKN